MKSRISKKMFTAVVFVSLILIAGLFLIKKESISKQEQNFAHKIQNLKTQRKSEWMPDVFTFFDDIDSKRDYSANELNELLLAFEIINTQLPEKNDLDAYLLKYGFSAAIMNAITYYLLDSEYGSDDHTPGCTVLSKLVEYFPRDDAANLFWMRALDYQVGDVNISNGRDSTTIKSLPLEERIGFYDKKDKFFNENKAKMTSFHQGYFKWKKIYSADDEIIISFLSLGGGNLYNQWENLQIGCWVRDGAAAGKSESEIRSYVKEKSSAHMWKDHLYSQAFFHIDDFFYEYTYQKDTKVYKLNFVDLVRDKGFEAGLE